MRIFSLSSGNLLDQLVPSVPSPDDALGDSDGMKGPEDVEKDDAEWSRKPGDMI